MGERFELIITRAFGVRLFYGIQSILGHELKVALVYERIPDFFHYVILAIRKKDFEDYINSFMHYSRLFSFMHCKIICYESLRSKKLESLVKLP